MPLLPKYVSTVDSGNYAAALLTLSARCGSWRRPSLMTRPGARERTHDLD
jgi:hypothetical protein